jgi:CubicO group peptidase (beta-lactamase class C family)
MTNADLEALLQTHYPVGIAAIILKDGARYQACSGLADRERGTPVTPHTTFEIASCTKMFTGYCVQLLEQAGQLNIREKACSELPGITCEMLLHHTSGLPDYLDRLVWRDTLCNEDVIGSPSDSVRQFPPGEKYEYSNTNYVVLARLLEERTRMPYPALLHEAVFGPLGMNRSTVFPRGNCARGYDSDGSLCEYPSYIYGDGSIWTCIDDLAKWLAFVPQLFGSPLLKLAHALLTNVRDFDGDALGDEMVRLVGGIP